MHTVSTTAKVTGLIPMAHAVSVQRSVDFYKLFGMEVVGSLRDPHGALQWVHLSSDRAHVMFARASGAIDAEQQAVLFYLYSPDLLALRDHLLANKVNVSAITYPHYM